MKKKIKIPDPNIKKLQQNHKIITKEFKKYERQTKESLYVSQKVLNKTITI